ncbi:MAG: hypothetical protein N2999_00030 [Proteobacteria bacterium]|nr:hypothetical protein [Pseudomonadota bacterium]
MLEIFVVIQTIVIIAIFIIFLLIFLGLKREGEILKEKFSKFESEVQPVLSETRNLLSNLNHIAGSVKEITDNAKEVTNKIKESVSTAENVIDNLKQTFTQTRSKISILKLGIQTGASTLLGYYLKKLQKKEE